MRQSDDRLGLIGTLGDCVTDWSQYQAGCHANQQAYRQREGHGNQKLGLLAGFKQDGEKSGKVGEEG